MSVALALPLLLLAMSEIVPGQPVQRVIAASLRTWIERALASPAVLWAGWPLFVRGWQSIVNRGLNMFTLIAIGVGVASGYSLFAAIFPDAFPESFRGPDGSVPVYFEAAAVITALVLLGQVLEIRARSHASSAIKALLGLATLRCGPSFAFPALLIVLQRTTPRAGSQRMAGTLFGFSVRTQ